MGGSKIPSLCCQFPSGFLFEGGKCDDGSNFSAGACSLGDKSVRLTKVLYLLFQNLGIGTADLAEDRSHSCLTSNAHSTPTHWAPFKRVFTPEAWQHAQRCICEEDMVIFEGTHHQGVRWLGAPLLLYKHGVPVHRRRIEGMVDMDLGDNGLSQCVLILGEPLRPVQSVVEKVEINVEPDRAGVQVSNGGTAAEPTTTSGKGRQRRCTWNSRVAMQKLIGMVRMSATSRSLLVDRSSERPG